MLPRDDRPSGPWSSGNSPRKKRQRLFPPRAFFMLLSFPSQNRRFRLLYARPRARRGAAPIKPFSPMLRAITAKRPMEQRDQPPQKAAAAISAARFLHAFVFPKSEQELSASIFKAARSAQGSAYQAFSAHAPRDDRPSGPWSSGNSPRKKRQRLFPPRAFFMLLSFPSQNRGFRFLQAQPRARRGAAPIKPFPPMLRAITAKRSFGCLPCLPLLLRGLSAPRRKGCLRAVADGGS